MYKSLMHAHIARNFGTWWNHFQKWSSRGLTLKRLSSPYLNPAWQIEDLLTVRPSQSVSLKPMQGLPSNFTSSYLITTSPDSFFPFSKFSFFLTNFISFLNHLVGGWVVKGRFLLSRQKECKKEDTLGEDIIHKYIAVHILSTILISFLFSFT